MAPVILKRLSPYKAPSVERGRVNGFDFRLSASYGQGQPQHSEGEDLIMVGGGWAWKGCRCLTASIGAPLESPMALSSYSFATPSPLMREIRCG